MKNNCLPIFKHFFLLAGLLLAFQFQSLAQCHASFTYSVNQTTRTVTFTNTSTATGPSYLWRFGNGSTSGSVNPVFTYPNYGTYTVCLYVVGAGSCYDSTCTVITVGTACNPVFGNTSDTINNPKTVHFSPYNTGTNLSYFWTFGDSSTSTSASPYHTYLNFGTYTACLRISKAYNGDTCTSTYCKQINIVNNAGCHAAFTYTINPTTKAVTFTNSSTGIGLSYNWKFGDNTTSSNTHPVKTYSASGTYNVCLIIYSSTLCIDSFCTPVIISNNSCNGGFSSSTDTSSIFMRRFYATPGAANLVYSWNFGDSSVSNLRNPVHTYANVGTYTVCMRASRAYNGDSCNILTCNNAVIGNAGCHAAFSYSINPTTKAVTFTNSSTGTGLFYFWKFGDNTSSSSMNPVKVYSVNGTYNVCLKVYNGSSCIDSSCTSIFISETGLCYAAFTVTYDSLNRKLLHFNAYNSGSNLNYYWTFGDSTSSTIKNPDHTYAAYITYNVCLRVTKAYNGDTCNTLYCTNVTPTNICNSNFIYSNDSINKKRFNFNYAGTNVSGSSYLWNFGDSSTSTSYNPIHTFAANGIYNVCLRVIKIGADTCVSEKCMSVIVGCRALFSYNSDTLNFLKVNFSNVSHGSGLTYNWSFGNGTSSTLKNPFITYTTPGNYLVCLTVHSTVDSTCNDTKCQTIVVTAASFCHAQFLFVRDSTNILKVHFANISTGDSLTTTWSFGDGTGYSNVRSPEHTYAHAGTYFVCMNVTRSNPTCSSYRCDSVTVGSNPGSCEAQFLFSVNASTKTVVFANTSSGSRLKYAWSFGDSTASTIKNPIHTYSSAGLYRICLYVVDSMNINCNAIKCIYLLIPSTGTNCTATFSHSLDTANHTGYKYIFNAYSNYSSTSTYFRWTFGDGDSSNTKNPNHIYSLHGTYNVCLRVTNTADTCSTIHCETISTATGIMEQTNVFQTAKFYPNPFDEQITIELNAVKQGKLSISIYDLAGREHYTNAVMLNRNINRIEIETSQLPKGVYLIKLNADDENYYSKLVK